MLNYIVRRLLIAAVMLVGVAFVSFVVIQLPPGDFATSYKAFLLTQAGMTDEDAERQADNVRRQYGLDQPVPVQFVTWIKGMVTEASLAIRLPIAEMWVS